MKQLTKNFFISLIIAFMITNIYDNAYSEQCSNNFLQNPGAENSDNSDWLFQGNDDRFSAVKESGTIKPHSGEYFFYPDPYDTVTALQVVNISSFIDEINNNNAEVQFGLWARAINESGFRERAKFAINFLNSEGASIKYYEIDDTPYPEMGFWKKINNSIKIPPDTNLIKIYMIIQHNVCFDDAYLTICTQNECGTDNLDLCNDKSACESVGGHWCNNICQASTCQCYSEEDLESQYNLGKQQCISDPASCGIQVVSYTEEQLNQKVAKILMWGDTDHDGKIGLTEAIRALLIASEAK